MRTTETRVVALLLLAAACRSADRSGTPQRVVLASFSGEVDAVTGTVTVRGEPAPGGAVGPGRAAIELPVDNGGKAGSGPPDTVELVTESVATIPGGCGAVDGFEGAIRVRSFYAGAVLTNVHAELVTLTPTGHEACNSAPAAGGLSATYGLWDYGTLGRAGTGFDSGVRAWRFRLPDQTGFSFRGHLVGDLVTSDSTPPTTAAIPGAGTYAAGRSVELRCTDAETGCAATYYTTDGSTPTARSAVYSAPIPIASSFTLRWFSVDQWGNAEAVQSASYVLDAVAPTVLATDPAAGSTGVAEGALVAVTFSEPMDRAPTAAAFTLAGPSGPVPGTATWDGAGQVLTFAPAAPLSRGATYAIGVGTGARDVAGNALAAPFSAAFSTRSATDQVSGPGSATLEPGGIAFDAAGNGLAVWRARNGQKISYACYSADSGTWSGAVVLDAMSGAGYQAPRVAAGTDGFAVAWIGSGVLATVFTGCVPGATTSLASGFYGYSVAVASNGAGYLVVWAGTQYGSQAALFEGGAWSSAGYFTSDTFPDALAAAGEGTGYRVVYLKSNYAYAVQRANGAWGSRQLLGHETGSTSPAVASSGGVTCMAWQDLYVYARVEQGGTGTTTQVMLDGWGSPAVAMNGGRCQVVAAGSFTGASAALYDGSAWRPAASLGFSGTVTGVGVAPWGGSDFAAVAIAGGDVWVSRSTSGTWGTPIRAESGSDAAHSPYIAAGSPSSAYLLFEQPDATADQVWTVRYDGASAAAPDLRSTLSAAGTASGVKLAAAANGDALAIWTQLHRGTSNVYWARRQGQAWSAAQLLATDAAGAAIASNGVDFMVAYEGGLSGTRTLVARRFAGGAFGAPTTLVSGSSVNGGEVLASDGSGYAIGYLLYVSGSQPVVQIFDGASWLAQKQLTAQGSTSTALSLAGRSGEYLAAWINQASAVSAMSWRAVKSGATWSWDAAARTMGTGTGYTAVALAAGPTEFMAVWYASGGVVAAPMTGGGWGAPATLRSGADVYAIASNGTTYLVATQHGTGGTQLHAWNGGWQGARSAGFTGAFSLAVVSDGAGYGVLADGSSQVSFVSVPDPISLPVGVPVRVDSDVGTGTSSIPAPLVAAAGGFLAAWQARDPGDPTVTRIYARGGL